MYSSNINAKEKAFSTNWPVSTLEKGQMNKEN